MNGDGINLQDTHGQSTRRTDQECTGFEGADQVIRASIWLGLRGEGDVPISIVVAVPAVKTVGEALAVCLIRLLGRGVGKRSGGVTTHVL